MLRVAERGAPCGVDCYGSLLDGLGEHQVAVISSGALLGRWPDRAPDPRESEAPFAGHGVGRAGLRAHAKELGQARVGLGIIEPVVPCAAHRPPQIVRRGVIIGIVGDLRAHWHVETCDQRGLRVGDAVIESVAPARGGEMHARHPIRHWRTKRDTAGIEVVPKAGLRAGRAAGPSRPDHS